jgi:hypothetical protein
MGEVDLVETAKPIAVQLCVLEECLKRDCGDNNHNQAGLIGGTRLWMALAAEEIEQLRKNYDLAASYIAELTGQWTELDKDLLGREIERLRSENRDLWTALSRISPDCAHLSHRTDEGHSLGDPCPVEVLVRAALHTDAPSDPRAPAAQQTIDDGGKS